MKQTKDDAGYLVAFKYRRDACLNRCLRGIRGNYNISDDTLLTLAKTVFDSGVLAGISRAYELQLEHKDVREALK